MLALPLSVIIPRKTKEDKVFMLNLNVYRNAHYQVMSDAKNLWKSIVEQILSGAHVDLPEPPWIFHYTIFPGDGRGFDVGNVAPAIQKFTDDALQELGVIKNDNYKFIRENRHKFGAIDRENPRCELRIEAWKET